MIDAIQVRFATPVDAGILAAHRVAMFRDMGSIDSASEKALHSASAEYFAGAVASGEYVGWLASLPAEPDRILAGGGVQFRTLLPRPEPKGPGLLLGREGLILNVYVDPAWRRRGLARRLMQEILGWAPGAGISRLVLHASADGRPLYEGLGFVTSNEMRFAGGEATAGRS